MPLLQVSDVFSRRVQPRSDSETSKHSTTNITDVTAAKASKQAPPDSIQAEPESLTLADEQQQEVHEEQQPDQIASGKVDGFKLRVKAPEPHRSIRTVSGASG